MFVGGGGVLSGGVLSRGVLSREVLSPGGFGRRILSGGGFCLGGFCRRILTSFLPTTSIARERYPIRYPRLQPPICSHEYISKTCKYRLPVLLNSINNNSVISAKLNETIANVDNISLLNTKV